MQKQKNNLTAAIREYTVITFLLIGGAYFLYIAAHGFLTNQASTIGKDSSWLTRTDYPTFFWISILFHAWAGVFAILIATKMFKRVLRLNRSKQ
jgi:hypothetical protein